VESVINELNERFIDNKITINAFHSLFTTEKLEDDFIKLTKYYQEDIESGIEAILNAENKLWQRCLQNLIEKSTNALQTITLCNK